jgi:hypothetical protein
MPLKKHIFFLFLAFLQLSLSAQTFTSSNLPIVIIDTDINPTTGKPYDIPDEPKVGGNMTIIYRPDGSRNYLTDKNNPSYLNYNGRIGIEKRGSSSQDLPKKPYGLTTYQDDNITNNNVSILGMPKENDWVLNSLAFDPSLIRDFLSYELYGLLGNYSPRGVYCEVIVNNDYKGLYILMEKIKIDDNRVNIVKMTTADNNLPELSGGYITKCDKTTGGDPVAWTMATTKGWTVDFIHESPKPTEITTQQNNYIKGIFTNLQSSTTSQNGTVVSGFPSKIDIPSFLDFFIMNELASNPDGYQLSTFFHKDRNGKLRAGPIWDFNLTYGNDLFVYGFDRSKTNVWQFSDGGNDGAKFWNDLFNNTTFKCYLAKRWKEVTASNQPLSYSVIAARIDQLVALTTEAAAREQTRWGTVSTRTTNISTMKTWLQTRITWMNNNGLNNYQTCANVAVPPLVISKINYHPKATTNFPSDSLEFIEITNNGNSTVNLSGIYFRELGFTWQFPANSTLVANTSLMLASNAKSFESYYGFKPFGQFTRNLSNKSENMILVDAWGNVIDKVQYADNLPWPPEADGKGWFLELIDLNSDNSLASSWTFSNNISGVDNISYENGINIYPTPASSFITVHCSNLNIKSYEISDMLGRVIIVNNNYYSTKTINIEHLTPNIYFIKLNFDNGTSVVKKIIKN